MDHKNVLIIDDEQSSLDLICNVVESGGFTVHCAHGVNEAFELLEAADPFLVITDLFLNGEIDGATLADRMHRKNPLTVFIAISGYLSAFDLGYLLGAVFTDVIPKPFEAEQLRKIVRYAWEKRQRWETILMS